MDCFEVFKISTSTFTSYSLQSANISFASFSKMTLEARTVSHSNSSTETVKTLAIATSVVSLHLLRFAENDKIYKKICDTIIILVGTGLRISELCGLTVSDLDFKNRLINVDHQLLRDTEIGYYIEVPKTKSGIRQVPMTEQVYQALLRVLKNRPEAKPFVIDGYSNFLFLKKYGYPKGLVFRGRRNPHKTKENLRVCRRWHYDRTSNENHRIIRAFEP